MDALGGAIDALFKLLWFLLYVAPFICIGIGIGVVNMALIRKFFDFMGTIYGFYITIFFVGCLIGFLGMEWYKILFR